MVGDVLLLLLVAAGDGWLVWKCAGRNRDVDRLN